VVIVKAVAYCRVSGQSQTDKNTIENQKQALSEYTEKQGIVITRWYLDDGVGGGVPLDERPGGSKLLADAALERFDTILILRTNRLSRNEYVFHQALKKLTDLGIVIEFVDEAIDLGTAEGRLMASIKAAVSANERATFLKQTREGLKRRARDGKWLNGPPPYGYQVDGEGYLKPDNAPIPGLTLSPVDVIQSIYRLLVEEGYTCHRIAEYLNTLNVPTSATLLNYTLPGPVRRAPDGKWRAPRVRQAVVNTTYKGLHVYGERTRSKHFKEPMKIERKVQAIVEPEVWEIAQKKLALNKKTSPRNSKHIYLLRGLLRCGCCGWVYVGSGVTRKGDRYYQCASKKAKNGPFPGGCPSKYVLADEVEAQIWGMVKKFVDNPQEALELLTKSLDEPAAKQATLKLERQRISQELGNKPQERLRIVELYGRALITEDDLTSSLDRIETETKALQLRLKELDAALVAGVERASQFSRMEAILTDLKMVVNATPPLEVKRAVVQQLVRKITVHTFEDRFSAVKRSSTLFEIDWKIAGNASVIKI